jgi:hypothetical protein
MPLAESSEKEKFQVLVAERLGAIKMEMSAYRCLRALERTYEIVMQFRDTLDGWGSDLLVPSTAGREGSVAIYGEHDL